MFSEPQLLEMHYIILMFCRAYHTSLNPINTEADVQLKRKAMWQGEIMKVSRGYGNEWCRLLSQDKHFLPSNATGLGNDRHQYRGPYNDVLIIHWQKKR